LKVAGQTPADVIVVAARRWTSELGMGAIGEGEVRITNPGDARRRVSEEDSPR
jgi:hypothetical protein